MKPSSNPLSIVSICQEEESYRIMSYDCLPKSHSTHNIYIVQFQNFVMYENPKLGFDLL